MYIFCGDWPTGQNPWRVFKCNGSNDAVPRKGVPFMGLESWEIILNP